jgi:hypothetical protein
MPDPTHAQTVPTHTSRVAGGNTAACHLDPGHPAGRAITDLVTQITQLQARTGGDWPGAELVALLEAWLHGIGLDPDQLPTPPPAANAPGRADTGEHADDAGTGAQRWWPTPALRASWAAAALGTHRRSGPDGDHPATDQPEGAGLPSTDEDLATLCADLIADVLHLVGGAGLPVWSVLSRAVGYFQAEDAAEATAAAAAAAVAAAAAIVAGDEAPDAPAGHLLHLEEVARLVREAGVNCVLDTSGGGVATLWAGPTRHESGYGIRFAALAGPGSYGWGQRPSTGTTAEFFVGPDDNGQVDPLDVATVGARTELQVAALIVAQARLVDPRRPLTAAAARAALDQPPGAGPTRP